MIALGENQQAIDLVTLTESLHRVGELESSGGAPYLAALADGMPRVSNVEHYARIVREKALLRNLIHATHNIQQRALEGEDGADTILDNAESSIFALAEDRVKAGLIPVKDIVRDNFERLEKIFREGKSITGVSTGYTELDKLLSGLQPSELLILAARPSQGKNRVSTIRRTFPSENATDCRVFSLEMSGNCANAVFPVKDARRESGVRKAAGQREACPARCSRSRRGDAFAFAKDFLQALEIVADDVFYRDEAGFYAVFGKPQRWRTRQLSRMVSAPSSLPKPAAEYCA